MKIQPSDYGALFSVQGLTAHNLACAFAVLKRKMAVRGVAEIPFYEELSPEEKAMARGGEKTLAIKAYRLRLDNGISLKECREAIDQYIDDFKRADGTVAWRPDGW